MPEQKPFREVYALIWKASEPDETFSQEEFDKRIPRLMEWLKELYSRGRLVGCGGGGYENYSGGLTLINADNIDEARELSAGSPMNEIGTTEIFIWDVFYADLVDKSREERLK